MNGYSLMECLVPAGEVRMSLAGYPQLAGIDSWTLGARFRDPPQEPIALQWDPDTEGAKKAYYDATIPLMHRELVAALSAAGIDNLDCYPTRIEHMGRGESDTNYLAVNVIGAIRAADLGQSTYADPSGRRRIDMDFDRLVLEEKGIRKALLFRLAECTSGLIVGAQVRERLEAVGGFGLSFIAPEDWIG